MIEVFHKNDRYTRFTADGGASWPEKFDKVATVDLPDESYADVFRLTNSIEGGWWDNAGVTAHTESEAFFEVEEHPGVKGTRSTSVGDIIVLSDGRVMECASFGWDLIDDGVPDVLPDDPDLWRGDTTNGPKGGAK